MKEADNIGIDKLHPEVHRLLFEGMSKRALHYRNLTPTITSRWGKLLSAGTIPEGLSSIEEFSTYVLDIAGTGKKSIEKPRYIIPEHLKRNK